MLKTLVLSLFFAFSSAEKPRKAIIAIEMCMCGSVKWNRAKNFALKVGKKLDTIPLEVDYSIVQFAEDYIYDVPQRSEKFEDPEAFAGRGSNITFALNEFKSADILILLHDAITLVSPSSYENFYESAKLNALEVFPVSIKHLVVKSNKRSDPNVQKLNQLAKTQGNDGQIFDTNNKEDVDNLFQRIFPR